MNTVRPSSRNQQTVGSNGIGTTTAPPRRAKVATMAQMDISMTYPVKPLPVPGSTTTMPTNASRGSTVASSSLSNNSNSNNNGGNITYGYPATNNNTSGGYNTPPRLGSGSVRVRSSNSVATTASFRGTGGSAAIATGIVGRRDTGSVTSDDGTISEDSDRATDDMQLFSGGQSVNSSNVGIGVPFGSLGRQSSATGSIHSTSTTGPKIVATAGRQRTPSSTVGMTNGNSGAGMTTTAKPMRIAAGASIKIDSGISNSNNGNHVSSSAQSLLGVSSAPGSNAGSVVGVSSSVTSPASHLGVGSSRIGPIASSRNADDNGSVVSMSSAVTNMANTQQQPVIVRSAKSVTATSKLAEENRRAEEAARTRRKIADLEISNASLLQINQTLEATIRKQTAEMNDLKMRAQSGPYGDLGYSAADLALAQSVEAIELTEAEKQDDLMFKRICLTIEQMVYEAKHALDQSMKPTGVKVLSLYDMYEKEVLEEAEEAEDDDGEVGHSSFSQSQDKDEAGMSIEVLQAEADDVNAVDEAKGRELDENRVHAQGKESDVGADSSLSFSPPNMISSAGVTDRPLTMVT
ncbi:hypothetical protein BGX28_007394 [Mortierella sp. GBA30]|nr:hypothetical protein BGX28_007394 [Mortierella sp. GBA30]